MKPNEINSDDEEIFYDAFRSIRETEVPSELKSKCLTAAQDGWTQTTSINRPKPNGRTRQMFGRLAVVGASLLTGVSMGWVLRGQSNGTDTETIQDPPPQVARANSARAASVRSASIRTVDAMSHIEIGEGTSRKSLVTHEVYLCGIGRIASTSKYEIEGEFE